MMQTMDQQARVVAATKVIAEVSRTGFWENSQYRLSLDGPEIRVVDILTGMIVAYSSTRSDFDSSLEEFVWDFFTGFGEA